MDDVLSGESSFEAAFEAWIERRVLRHETLRTNAHYISERTEWDYRQYARALGKFFGGMRLQDIHPGHLREYQRARAFCDQDAGGWERQAGANRIRKEVGMLIRMLRSVGLWQDPDEDSFARLRPVENDVPRAMTPDEQHRFLHRAASQESWRMIYQYALVALQTTASTNELRGLRIGDVQLRDGLLQIRAARAKNKYRVRTIPLESPEVIEALEGLIQRARDLGATGPHCYLFPFRVSRSEYDLLRPMSDSGLKKRWAEVRRAAEMEWLRPYDLRHTAITRMAEAGVPIHVIMSFAGHMTMRMQQHYTAISMQSKRQWMERVWGADVEARRGPQPSARAPRAAQAVGRTYLASY